jgi:pyruvate dehydrogenase (quinone)
MCVATRTSSHPPHSTLEHVKASAEALLRGDEDAWGVLRQGIRQKVQQYLTGPEPKADR